TCQAPPDSFGLTRSKELRFPISMATLYYILSDHVPRTLGNRDGDRVTFTLNPGAAPVGYGVLFYMLDGQGGRGYRIDLNERAAHLTSAPPLLFTTRIHTPLALPRKNCKHATNHLHFTVVGAGPPINILHVVLLLYIPGPY